MDLGLLETFRAVVRAGGMRRAAGSLHVTQPAVSGRVRELERQLDVQLFERTGRRLHLTDAGRLLLEVELDDAELEARRAEWRAPGPRYTSGVLAKYAKLVSTAARGAVTD